jgi:hypothetical protein
MLALFCHARVPYFLVIVVGELSVVRVPCVFDFTLGFRCSNLLSFFGGSLGSLCRPSETCLKTKQKTKTP